MQGDALQKILKLVATAGVEAEAATGCPAALLMAQAILSAGLDDDKGNNYFGVKEYAGCYGVQLRSTEEWFTPQEKEQFLARGGGRTAVLAPGSSVLVRGRAKYRCRDLFATFPSLSACFVYHGKLLVSGGPYRQAWANFQIHGDLYTYVSTVCQRYDNDPGYTAKVWQVIVQTKVQSALQAAREELVCSQQQSVDGNLV